MAKMTKTKTKRTSKAIEVSDYPEFNIAIPDGDKDLETTLIICSNNGSDKKKTLHHARKRRMERPILMEIDCEETSYKVNNFAMTVDEAKKVVRELNRMIEYLEEV